MGNVGMYASGIPLGYMVDRKPKYGVMLGAFALGAGYFPIKKGEDYRSRETVTKY
jgi:hypothetical protein